MKEGTNIELSDLITSIVHSSLYLGLCRPKDPIGLAPPSVGLLWCSFHFLYQKDPILQRREEGSLVPKACLFSLLIFVSSPKQRLNDSECALSWNSSLMLLFHAWLQLKSKAKFKNTTLLQSERIVNSGTGLQSQNIIKNRKKKRKEKKNTKLPACWSGLASRDSKLQNQ